MYVYIYLYVYIYVYIRYIYIYRYRERERERERESVCIYTSTYPLSTIPLLLVQDFNCCLMSQLPKAMAKFKSRY